MIKYKLISMMLRMKFILNFELPVWNQTVDSFLKTLIGSSRQNSHLRLIWVIWPSSTPGCHPVDELVYWIRPRSTKWHFINTHQEDTVLFVIYGNIIASDQNDELHHICRKRNYILIMENTPSQFQPWVKNMCNELLKDW